MEINIKQAAKRLSEVIQFKTLSSSQFEEIDFEPFLKLHEYLRKTYPLIHQQFVVEVINTGALLYTLKSKQATKEPLLFMAHMDVVPVDERTKDQWICDGFEGLIKDQIIYGRGAKDMKNQMIAFFEAIETKLQEHTSFHHDVYICLGFDEENSGRHGMKKIVEVLKSRNVRIGTVLDEGGTISKGMLGIQEDIALVGVCEKGFANVKITATSTGGHASMPPIHSALGKVCKAASLLEENQMPMLLGEVFKTMLEKLTPLLPSQQIQFNQEFMNQLVEASPEANALLRTTTAITQAQGALAANILPNEASIVVNFRLIPGNTINDLLSHIKQTIGEGFEIELLQSNEASKISKMDHEFDLIENTIKKVCPEVKAVAPFVMVGATDSKYFDDLCDHIYKFGPFKCTGEELQTIHGINEFLRFEDLELGIRFFYEILTGYGKCK